MRNNNGNATAKGVESTSDKVPGTGRYAEISFQATYSNNDACIRLARKLGGAHAESGYHLLPGTGTWYQVPIKDDFYLHHVEYRCVLRSIQQCMYMNYYL